ncbi:MAG: TIGR00282 family metallophosphoesterase [Candidatus Komeilibacteria bacterium CG10_big_fil_rev_8_21_14_0_10_41_13]|uniref:TIGR00282 family metallophosphoesterase n=1 Tax=Candidatus Komeilibacteria bacterium CG10_big_fil_rev_8_21_14_0_10_41_13 TaxID=1974476 RepID=A0A2M6WCS3_9BACT|nr:MAG: TIGR00282 family metallophosphoesterase [Candidatus Komeilibacteria bacterium CG10_big_fil_rev_8_21_14_0_10_41_13]
MKILFLGDIVGKIGRRAATEILPKLKERYSPEVMIANVENLAHGKGVTSKTLAEMAEAGVDLMTSGNHVWKKEEVEQAIRESGVNLITPANDPRTLPGRGLMRAKVGSKYLSVVNLLGRVFINDEGLRCPFKEIDRLLEEIDDDDIVILDMHAEATSEKRAMGWYLDGRVAAVLGTHTHIPTADLQILPQGTAYITDVGMVGPVESVLGVKKEIIIEKFLTDSAIVFKIPEEGEVEVNGIYLEIDEQTNLAIKVERVFEKIEIK